MRVEKGTYLTRPRLRLAAINLLSTGMSQKDTAVILGISTTLLKKLLKGVKAPAARRPPVRRP
jgi:predicted transcriptional regulator